MTKDHPNEGHENLAWLDLETTGLDTETCSILEIGIVITDKSKELNVINQRSWVVHPTLPVDLGEIDPFVWNMHQKNGLWNELFIEGRAIHIPRASQEAIQFMRELKAIGSPMCGSNISFDRNFLEKKAPELQRAFHYRNLDVSTVKNMFKVFFPKSPGWAPPETKGHRALNDLQDTLSEMRHYLNTLQIKELF